MQQTHHTMKESTEMQQTLLGHEASGPLRGAQRTSTSWMIKLVLGLMTLSNFALLLPYFYGERNCGLEKSAFGRPPKLPLLTLESD